MTEFLTLLVGTVIYRPYVYAFLACFLAFATRHLGWRGALLYSVFAYLIAFVCEYSSTRNGFPFGPYVYVEETRTRELWVANVPFWDSLSFVFLSYFSWMAAIASRGEKRINSVLTAPSTAFLAGLYMMCLDVVIDPLTLLGDQWFLGRIYYYPDGGTYFGVTLANFGGWLFVGTAIVMTVQLFCRLGFIRPKRLDHRALSGSLAVYAGVFAFNLGVTAWIRQWELLAASSSVTILTLTPLFYSHLRLGETNFAARET